LAVTDVPAGDLRAQAEQFMALLDDLRVEGTPDAIAMRAQLVTIIEEYRDAPDKEQAKLTLMGRMLEVEAKVTVMVSRPVRTLRERLFKEMKRIGRHSQAGKTMTAMYEALGTVLDALARLTQAIESHDPVVRDHAHELLAKAQKELAVVGKR
jgi:hypothetical protein